MDLAISEEPPVRWVVGADAVAEVEQKTRALLAQDDAHRELSDPLSRSPPRTRTPSACPRRC